MQVLNQGAPTLQHLHEYEDAFVEVMGPCAEECGELEREKTAIGIVSDALEDALHNFNQHMPEDNDGRYTEFLARLRELVEESYDLVKDASFRYSEACDEYWDTYNTQFPRREEY